MKQMKKRKLLEENIPSQHQIVGKMGQLAIQRLRRAKEEQHKLEQRLEDQMKEEEEAVVEVIVVAHDQWQMFESENTNDQNQIEAEAPLDD
jgi:hypothetical protein